ncbi:MAG: PAS domain S-box protein, partial [Nitrospirota bacterium]|nr:PAS domain S-box protein [Nitrospirota bacterium]
MARKKPSKKPDVERLKAQIAKLKKIARETNLIRKKLESSEELYKNLVNTSQDLIWKCDAKGRFTFLNPAWEATLEYSLDEMIGRPFTDFQKPEVARRDLKEFAKHLAGGMIRGYETTQITKSGNEVTMLFNAIPLFDYDGKIIGTQGTATDITWSKEAEERLEKQSKQLKRLLDERTLEVRIKNNALESSVIAIAFTGHDGL